MDSDIIDISDLESFVKEELGSAIESQKKLLSFLEGMVKVNKQQGNQLKTLEGVIAEQSVIINDQKGTINDLCSSVSHKIRMLEFQSVGHDFQPEEIKANEELDEITARWKELKESGELDKQKSSEKDDEMLKFQTTIKVEIMNSVDEKMKLIDQKLSGIESFEKQREEDEKKMLKSFEEKIKTEEEKMHADTEAAAIAVQEAKDAAKEARDAADLARQVQNTGEQLRNLAKSLKEDMANQKVVEHEMEEHVMKAMRDQLGTAADNIEKDVIAHIADLSVNAGPTKEDLDNFQGMVEAKLYEVTGATPAVPTLATVTPTNIPVADDATSDLVKSLQQSIESLENKLVSVEKTANEALNNAEDASKIATANANHNTANSEEFEEMIKKVQEAAERSTSAPEFFNQSSSSGERLSFPESEIVRYDNGKLSEQLISEIRDRLNLTKTITDIMIAKAGSDELASTRDRVADIAGNTVTLEMLKSFALLGDSSSGMDERVVNAALSIKAAIKNHCKINVNNELEAVKKAFDEKIEGQQAYTNLQVKRSEERMTDIINKAHEETQAITNKMSYRVDESESKVQLFSDRVDSLMWTDGARTADGSLLKRDPLTEANREKDIMERVDQLQGEMVALTQYQEAQIQSAERRADQAVRESSQRVSFDRLNEAMENMKTHFLNALHDNVNILHQNVNTLKNSMRETPSREEVLSLFQGEKISVTASNVDDDSFNDGTAAGSFSCISCGSRRAPSPPRSRPVTQPTYGDTLLTNQNNIHPGSQLEMYAAAPYDLPQDVVPIGTPNTVMTDNLPAVKKDVDSGTSNITPTKHLSSSLNRGSVYSTSSRKEAPPGVVVAVLDKGTIEKYKAISEVVNREAGLKNLRRQHKPMNIVKHPFLKKGGNQPPEPIFRKAKMAASIREQTKPRAQTAQPIGRSTVERQMYLFEDNGEHLRRVADNQKQHNSSIFTGNPSNLGTRPVRTGPGHLPISVPASQMQSKTMPSLHLSKKEIHNEGMGEFPSNVGGVLQELSLGSLGDHAQGLGSPTRG